MAAPRDAIDMAVRAIPVDTLTDALGLGSRELVALVGSGGKTSALRLLAGELAASGARVGVTTTTAMFLREMAVVGPVVMGADGRNLVDGLRKALAKGRTVAVARSVVEGGKVAGLSPAAVDELWAEGLVDYLIVEADGSRGKSLKAFGPHEPQVPAATTTILQLAGLDAVGAPLDDEYVHRAQTLATVLAVPIGSELTAGVFADALRAQVRRLRQGRGAHRIVAMLNKADRPGEEALGLAVARELLDGARGADRPPRAVADERPDSVVVASLEERRFAVVSSIEVCA
jgi:probable selenium-dependent hydroxylase accessory protein YqeC